eukprot:scaffold33647_cov49-Attheya_sp.AAC.2
MSSPTPAVERMPMVTPPPSSRYVPAFMVDPQLEEPQVVVEPEEEEELSFLGAVHVTIVGIRYYDGCAHPGEFVSLHREPNNPYDRNAIRVENMNDQKVGHIKKEQAAALAPLMDSSLQSRTLQIDGTIPYKGNAYTIPVRIDFRAPGADIDASLLLRLTNKFKAHRIPFSRDQQQESTDSRSSAASATPTVQKKTLDWRTQQKDLDDMFETQTKEQLANLPEIQMPSQFCNMELFPHQTIGIRWLVHRETATNIPVPFYKQTKEKGKQVWLSEITHCSQTLAPKHVKGSLLCDNMGLGKSVQALGLILCCPPPGHTYPQGTCSIEPPEVETTTDTTATTASTAASTPQSPEDSKKSATSTAVAVTPMPAICPTRTGVKKLKIGALRSVLFAAGLPTAGNKAVLVNDCWNGLSDGSITAQLFASSVNNTFVPLAKPKPTTCSAISATNVKVSAAIKNPPLCTLIVCPVSVMSNWIHQIDIHLKKGVLRYAIYHGTDRGTIRELVQSNELDVLIVSYNTLAADHGKLYPTTSTSDGEHANASKKRKADAHETLFDVEFHRLILDEAHIIRSMKTRMFKACKALKAERRLCLTGTPLQNKSDDINSLFSFLQLEPLGDKEVFRRAISQPIKEGNETGLARLRAMMCHVALRRNKTLANLNMPEKEVQLRSVSFPEGSIHKSIHDALFESARAAFEATLLDGDDAALKNYVSVLERLLRIRQACCSGILVPKERRERAQEVMRELHLRDGKALTAEEGRHLLEKLKGTFHSEQDGTSSDEAPECAVCLLEMEESDAVILRSCSHVFCELCIARVMAMPGHTTCPLCRSEFSKADMVKKVTAATAASATPMKEVSITSDDVGSSPKIDALLQAMSEMKPDEKGVIFSQFTKFLDEIQPFMKASNHSFTRIDGSKSPTDRIKAMTTFNSQNGGPRFILCSLHAAGTGINLTRGNHIFMMDTWWNKAVEVQAMDRVHRIGQKRNVRVVRFVMTGSIEERIVDLQERKATLAKGAMEKLKPEEIRNMRVGDLKTLFQITPAQMEE